MVYCFVPYCNSNSNKKNSEEEKRRFFTPSKDPEMFKKWIDAIKRSDRVLDLKQKVCDLHFQAKYIVKEDVIVLASGQREIIPRKNWKLLPDAYPTENLKLRNSINYDLLSNCFLKIIFFQ